MRYLARICLRRCRHLHGVSCLVCECWRFSDVLEWIRFFIKPPESLHWHSVVKMYFLTSLELSLCLTVITAFTWLQLCPAISCKPSRLTDVTTPPPQPQHCDTCEKCCSNPASQSQHRDTCGRLRPKTTTTATALWHMWKELTKNNRHSQRTVTYVTRFCLITTATAVFTWSVSWLKPTATALWLMWKVLPTNHHHGHSTEAHVERSA